MPPFARKLCRLPYRIGLAAAASLFANTLRHAASTCSYVTCGSIGHRATPIGLHQSRDAQELKMESSLVSPVPEFLSLKHIERNGVGVTSRIVVKDELGAFIDEIPN